MDDDLTRRRKQDDLIFQEIEEKERLAAQADRAEAYAELQQKAKVAGVPFTQVVRMFVALGQEGKTATEAMAEIAEFLATQH